ncbi:MAG: dipeptidase, partial [Clostridia bacterium]|nr:dipeptidase [Clostridia bacterium]
YSASVQNIERYQLAVATKGREIIREYDEKMIKAGDFSLTEEANEKLSAMAEKETTSTLNKVLQTASEKMKNGYNLADN